MVQDSDSKGTRHWTLAERILAVLTALLALATATLGFMTEQFRQGKEQVQASAEGDIAALQGENGQLRQQNKRLESENLDLRSELGLPGPTANPQVASAATVRHAGTIDLSASGFGADLDAPASDPQWQGDYLDITYYGRHIEFGFTGNSLYTGKEKADYDLCRGRTGYTSGNRKNRIDIGAVANGDYFCLKTNEYRYSAVRITRIEPEIMAIDVVTYDPPER